MRNQDIGQIIFMGIIFCKNADKGSGGDTYPNHIWPLSQRSQGFHLHLTAEHCHAAALQNKCSCTKMEGEHSVQEVIVSPCLILFTIKYEPSKSPLHFIFRLKGKKKSTGLCHDTVFYFRASDWNVVIDTIPVW